MPEKQNDRRNWYGSDRDRAESKKPVKKRLFWCVYIQKKSVGRLGKVSRLAGDFAVKEAVSKVFGTGFRGFGLLDIEVLRDELGKPWVRLHGEQRNLRTA